MAVKTKFCWHCSKKLYASGKYRRYMFINGQERSLHRVCKEEIEENPKEFGYIYKGDDNGNTGTTTNKF